MENRTDHSDLPLAIIGMSCKLPGAECLDEYWRLILEGGSAVSEAPADRLERDIYFDPRKSVRGKTYSTKAALLQNRTFDRARCPLPDGLLHTVDSTHLLMTQVAAEAFRHAGYDPFNLPNRNASVFIGHADGSTVPLDLTFQTYIEDVIDVLFEVPHFSSLPQDHQRDIQKGLLQKLQQDAPPAVAEARFLCCNMVAGTIAKAFNLTGAWLALNSACSSSLLAVMMGARALQRGHTDMVVVGGASDCKADTLVLFSNAQTLSTDVSRPFDAEAEGLVLSEGYVALVMKTLEKALADGDPIQAVVRGLGVASDGRGKSLWAPLKDGQIRAMKRAYRCGLDMSRLQYIEAHATATQLGDATELDAIAELLRPALSQGTRVPITSVKANIGHALEAAGIAGMIKTVLCLQNRIIPQAINIRQLNARIDWDNVPFYIPQQVSTWEQPMDGGPRMAGVNAFGIGGLNMHVVVEEFRPEAERRLTQKMKRPESPDDRAVAIIGMGCISPAGCDPSSFFNTLLAGIDPKSEVPQDRWPPACLRQKASQGEQFSGGFIADYQYDWRKHKIPPKQVQQADPLQFMFLDASEQALADAGYTKDTVAREFCGVVIGTEFGGEFVHELKIGLRLPRIQHELAKIMIRKGFSAATTKTISAAYEDAVLKKWPALFDESGSFTSSTLASRITKTLDLKGGAVAIDGGATSGLSALAICVDALLSGDNDIMICAAGQRHLGPSAFKDLKASGQLSKLQSPFSILDAHYDGILPSEGVGAVVLKRLADARRDGDPIRAVIRGLGVGSDQSAAKAMRIAMQKAATQADIQLDEVELLNLDTDERAFISETLDSIKSAHTAKRRRRPLLLSSSTAQLGHAGGASSLFALMKTSLELQNAQVCGSFKVQQPNECLAVDANAIQMVPSSAKLTGWGLGATASWSNGQAFYVLLDDGKSVRPKSKPLPISTVSEQDQPRIIRMGAASYERLSQRLAAVAGNELALWHDANSGPFRASDRVRMAVVAGNPEALAQKIGLARTQLDNPASQLVLMQQGIFCQETPDTPPRVAFLFPGQGSQYEGMLRELVEQSPGAFKAAADADRAMQQLGYPTFAELAWASSSQLGKGIWATQISMLLADKICLDALQEQGVLPDLVLGHSYGEFAALLAAGVWDMETAIRMTKARCAGIEAVSLKNAGLLASNAPPNDIKSLIQSSGLRLYLATFNAPDQTVVGGKTEELKRLANALIGRSFTARMLTVPAAFHTPLMAGSSRMLVQALQTIDLRPPEIPLISTVSNQVVEDPARVRANLGVQLTTPLHYAPLIERLSLETPTLFVEVGPQQILTKLNRRILSDSKTAIACDNPKSGGLEQVLCVKALLECWGEKGPASSPVVTLPTQPSCTTPVRKSSRSTVDLSSDKEQSPMDDILYFDATARRREKMRMASKMQPRKANRNGQAENAFKEAAGKPNPPAVSKTPVCQQAVPSPVHRPTDVQPVKAQEPIASTMTSTAELERFLINFVVEQTGYPPEVVELDADLEADLGIDSIKKAQLFGELQEYFEIDTAATDISLDDFPTLRHVMNFLADHGRATASPTTSKAAAELIELSPERGSDPVATTAPMPEPARSASTSPEELEGFLISFVVEQTGYPPEVVELDADLEADLGIDSIKKAQLFGELQEYFEIDTAATDISLDDFPTLRHVMNFLANHGRALAEEKPPPDIGEASFSLAAPAPAVETNKTRQAPVAVGHSTPLDETVNSHLDTVSAPVQPDVTSAGQDEIELAGTPYELGWQHGLRFRSDIQESLRSYVDDMDSSLDELPDAGNSLVAEQVLSADELDELQGMADAVQVPLGNILAHYSAAGTVLGQRAVHRINRTLHQLRATHQTRTPQGPRRDHAALVQPEIATRFELQMRDAPLPADVSSAPTWTGSAVILGTDAIAEELATRLTTDGINACQLNTRDSLASLVDQVDQISQQGPVHHLFITKDWQRVASLVKEDSLWSAELYHQVEKAFFVCQRFISIADEANRLPQCTVVLCTGLGGDFGFSRGASDPASGALPGLMKAIFFEFAPMRKGTGPRIKIIDSDLTETPTHIVNQIYTELASDNLEYEVSWRGHRRQTPFARERAVQPSTAILPPAGVWIATGGARGITAACALELGKRYNLKLHLIGTTPLEAYDPSWRDLSDRELQKLKAATMITAKQAGKSALGAWQKLQKTIEIDRTLQDFAAAGVSATYHACDVSNHGALAQVLAHIRQQDGPITGVLHGAGYEKSCRFAKKQRADVRQTIAAKVAGAANLVALTRCDPIRHFISFGSIAGRWGNPGQTDYCLANDWVCKLMGGFRRQRPWIKFTGFHWHPWGEIGMASRPETRSIIEGRSDLKLLPLAEGIGHLIREVEAGLPHPEVIITQRLVWQRIADGPGRLVEDRENHTLAASRTDQPSAASEAQTANHRNIHRTNEEAADSEDVAFKTTRCEFRLLSAPLPVVSQGPPVFDTPVWIYGDNALAQALHERLETGGVEVYRFNQVDNLDFALKQLESLHPNTTCKYLFLLSGSDPIPSNCLSASEIERRRHRGIIAPYFIAQHWYQRLLKQPPSGMASLTATVSLGGAFGLAGEIGLPEGGGICGMLKSIHIEASRRQAPKVRCKAIDFDATDTPPNMVDALLRELGADQPEVEVSWAKQQRRVVRPAPTPLVPASFDNMPRNGVWIVTGGARGITAVSARALAKRYGWKLHLLGKSPAPAQDTIWRAYNEQELKTLKRQMMRQSIAEGQAPGEAWDRVLKDREIFENLNRFADEGIDATYHSCDVTNRAELAQVLDEIRQSGDSIDGIIYGAGTTGAGRFEHRKRSDVEKIVRTKYDGLMHLLALTQDDPLTHCIGFGSISGRFGGNGFSDYAAGNDAMAKIHGWLRAQRPECAAICIHWPSWESPGMATLPRYAWGPKSVMKMKYMTPEEGIRRLEQELATGGGKAEVLYAFGDACPLLCPDEQQAPGPSHATLSPQEFPLIISTQADAEGFTVHVAFDPVLDPFLAHHRLRGKPLLPAVGMLEALCEAATAATGQKVAGYRKVEMLEGLVFHSEKPATVQVRIVQTSGSILDCCLTHDFRNRAGALIQKDRLLLGAKVEIALEPERVNVALPEMPTQWHEIEYPNDGPIFHGEPFRCLKAIQCDASGGWGKLTALPFEDFAGQAQAGQWRVPAHVLDASFCACGSHLLLHRSQAFGLPRLIDRLVLGRMPSTGESCYVFFQCRGITETSASYDFTLVGDGGELIAQATGYHTVILTRESPQGNAKKTVSRTHF